MTPISYSLNFREAMQTPAEGISDQLSSQSPQLLPPPDFNFEAFLGLLPNLARFSNLSAELFNPISSPTLSSNLKKTISEARKFHNDQKIALHTRLSLEDVDCALGTGTKRLYVYTSLQPRNYQPGFTVGDILKKLEAIALICEKSQVEFIRASLEHSTLTPPQQMVDFLKGIAVINTKLARPLIKGIGIPDTTGVATPDLYSKYMKLVVTHIPKPPMMLFTHLHDDSGCAEGNIKVIRNMAMQHHLPLCIELVPRNYPGERAGIKPYFENYLPKRIRTFLPEILRCVTGESWVKRRIPRQFVSTVHVAGVHTNSMGTYANQSVINYPHPGLYTIMGATNIQFVQRTLWKNESSLETLKSAAILGREISARYGNLSHAWAINLAKLALESPELIKKKAKTLDKLDGFYNKINPKNMKV